MNSLVESIKLVPQRPFCEQNHLTNDSIESSASEYEAQNQASNFADDNMEFRTTKVRSTELLKSFQV